MLFLQFIILSSFFVGIRKNKIPGTALQLWQFKNEQFSPGILEFSTKHLIIFGTQIIKLSKNGRVGPFFHTIFPFLMTMFKHVFHFSYQVRTKLTKLTKLFGNCHPCHNKVISLWIWGIKLRLFHLRQIIYLAYVGCNIDFLKQHILFICSWRKLGSRFTLRSTKNEVFP